MNVYHHTQLPRTYRRVSAPAITSLASTPAQAARLAALSGHAARTLWDHHLIDRLQAPVSRFRE